MSVNVKINNVVYNGIVNIRLPLADGSGFASFKLSGDEPEPGALYSLLADGDYECQYSRFTVSGNSVSATAIQAGSGPICLTSFIHNDLGGDTAHQNAVKALPEFFSIPAGAHVVTKLTNINNPNAVQFSVYGKITGTYTTVSLGTVNTQTSGDVTGEKTFAEAVSISCLMMYGELLNNQSLSFDLEITVDGVRYI